MLARLHRAKPVSTKKASALLDQASGLTYSYVGILADGEIRRCVQLVACHTCDSTHALWSNVTGPVELHLCIEACRRAVDLRFAELDLLCRSGMAPLQAHVGGAHSITGRA